MSIKNEVMAIAELSFDLSEVKVQVHCCIQRQGVSVTVFSEDHEIEWQQNLYEWDIDEAYIPKLRLLRLDLERLLESTKSANRQEAS